ncbi:MAG: Septum formation protein Maf [uncultured Truepera sp.]|uniref:dTTP/UTP pyrophosphatase n=1 Tax=uncultured Truepera sp. TaxID=543023 RepID=A0A6J4VH65_9DEIN|nr:MAG: Septum formation protein Maf [uncultured Truepera sp.]
MTPPLRLILASASPRRRELLANLNFPFEVVPADIDESFTTEDEPFDLVRRLSTAKAETVAQAHPDALVLAADTVVVSRDEILGKPKTAEENLDYITRLSGRTHEVFTGHAFVLGDRRAERVVQTAVRFRKLSDGEITRYVATGEGMDKAGGYAIQGYGSALVREVRGCYFNVVGLSIPNVAELAQTFGFQLV